MNPNDKRRLTELWEDRHVHDDDLQEQITIIRTTLDEQGEALAASGSGAYIHLLRLASQSIAAGGAAIEWDTQYVGIPPYEFNVTVPTTEIVIPKTDYYDVDVELEWETFNAGGSVWVTRERGNVEVTMWPPPARAGSWTASNGREFTKDRAPAIPCEAGDILRVYVDHNSGSAQTLASALVVVEDIDHLSTRRIFYAEVVLADGPAGYWQLDESSGTEAVDSAGTNHGTYVGSPTLGEPGVMVDGSGATSVEFDGSTQWVTVPQATVDGLTDLTVEAWINVDSATRFGIFNVNDAGAADAGRNRWGFWVTAAGELQYSDDASNNSTSTGTITANQRHYVAFTRTATGELIFYIDGVEAGTDTVTVTSSEPGDTVQIGMDIDSAGNSDHLDGHVHQVAVYGRVLTPAEIEEHAQVGGI